MTTYAAISCASLPTLKAGRPRGDRLTSNVGPHKFTSNLAPSSYALAAASPAPTLIVFPSAVPLSRFRFFLFLAFLASASVQASEQWFLMARHGECTKIESESFKRELPDLGAVIDPHSFAVRMRKNGYATTVTQHTFPKGAPKGAAFLVTVPSKELSLFFVTAGLCSTFIEE